MFNCQWRRNQHNSEHETRPSIKAQYVSGTAVQPRKASYEKPPPHHEG